MAPVSWLRGWGARRGNMDGRRMRLYKGAGRPGRTHMGTQNVRFYRNFGPQISMGAENFHGGGDPSLEKSVLIAPVKVGCLGLPRQMPLNDSMRRERREAEKGHFWPDSV
eukprot:COSAG06_NODE_617_length_13753_cov_134.082241_13_plen_110_part_00